VLGRFYAKLDLLEELLETDYERMKGEEVPAGFLPDSPVS